MKEEHATMMAALLVAIGAVAVILYQHAMATNSVLAAVGAGSSTNAVPYAAATNAGPILGLAPYSLAGSPTPGQGAPGAQQATVLPMAIQPGYLLN